MPKRLAFAALLLGLATPLAAQDDSSEAAKSEPVEEAAAEATPRPRGPAPFAIDLSITKPRPESDRLLEEDCEEEADAGRIAGEIVVCRERTDRGPPMFDKQAWERDYAQRTMGASTPNVDGSGIRLPTEGSLIAIVVTIPFGKAPDGPLMIDVEALPEAPAGSDADRIARGLPPLGEDAGGEVITEDQLGLPPVPSLEG